MTSEFPLSYRQTREKIGQYKEMVENGTFEKADFWHFCGFLGVDDETVLQLIRKPTEKEAPLALELKRMVSWIRGQYATAPGWSGTNGSKAVFLLKQDLGGLRLTDKPEAEGGGTSQIVIRFGGESEDPFG